MKSLLNNQNLSYEELSNLLDKILEYKKWKVEKEISRDIRVAEIQSSPKRYTPIVSTASSEGDEGSESMVSTNEEERDFNDLSSYGFCRDIHIGKIAKTKIWEASNMKATNLFARWKAHIQTQNIQALKEVDDKRLRTLLLNFLWAHGCACRILRWPEASDMDGVKGLKADLNARLNKYPREVVVGGYASLREFWNEINDYNIIEFNATLIADILDQAEEEVKTKGAVLSAKDIKLSPMFQDFALKHPEVDLEYLEKAYTKCRGDFVKACVMALRRHYSLNVPSEFADRFDQDEWKRRWHLFLPKLIEEWTKGLRNIKMSKLSEQKEWELTS